LVKETGKNAQHILLTWSNKMTTFLEWQRSLPNPRYENCPGLCGF